MRVNELLRLEPLKISPPDPRDSGLFPEKSGNPTDTRATVSEHGVRPGPLVLELEIELLF